MHLDPDTGYVQARELLEKEYGDLYKLSLTYLDKLTNWSVIRSEDSFGLKQLALFMSKCNNAMQSVSYLHVLNNPANMLCVTQKLPPYLQNKWREQASKARREQRVLLYPDLVKFVVDAADTANDPVYGKSATRHKHEDKTKVSQGQTQKQNQQFCHKPHQSVIRYKMSSLSKSTWSRQM